MRLIDLAIKDLTQIIRDRLTLLFLLIMPVAFTFFFGFVFGDQKETDTRLPVGLVNQDGPGVLAESFEQLLADSDTVRLVAVGDPDLLEQQLLDGDLAAGVVIPAGYSDAVLQGMSPRLSIILDEQTPNGQTARHALQTAITRLLGAAEMARLGADAYEAQVGFAGEEDRREFMADVVRRSVDAWREPPLTTAVTSAALSSKNVGEGNPYNQFSPGMIVQFAIFGLTQAGIVLVIERKSGAMQRLLTTPLRKAELIGGHLLSIFIMVFVQQVLLVAFGQIALGVNYLREPLAVLLIMVTLSLWIASFGLLIGTLAKKAEQVILITQAAMFSLSALGGAWFSLETTGKVFSTIGHFTPSAWAIDGFQNIVIRGLGFQSALLPAGILLAYAILFFMAALWRFRWD